MRWKSLKGEKGLVWGWFCFFFMDYLWTEDLYQVPKWELLICRCASCVDDSTFAIKFCCGYSHAVVPGTALRRYGWKLIVA